MNRKATVLAMIAFALVLVSLLPSMTPASPPTADEVAAQKTAPEITDEMPTQQQRIDAHIRDVAEEDFDDLVKHLANNQFSLIMAGSHPSEPCPELMFEVCLADRRVAKLYSLLTEMQPGERTAAVRSMCDKTYADMCEAWLAADRLVKDSTKDDDNQPSKAALALVKVDEKKRAASEALFLLAQFDSPAELLSRIARWETFAAENGKQSLPNAYPQPLFVLNLYLFVLTDRLRAGDLSSLLREAMMPEVDRLISEEYPQYADADRSKAADGWLALMELDDVPWIAWDGHTNAGDITHKLRAEDVNAKKTIRTFKVVRTWHKPDGTYTQRKAMLHALREWIDAALSKH